MSADVSLHRDLRDATRALHHRLDHHPLLVPLVKGPLSLAAYADTLAALHGPQAALEATVAVAPARLGKPEAFPPRARDLEADLAALRRSPWAMTAGFAADDDPAVLVGRLYVLEGSRCGSIVIARRLARMLPEAPCRFYATAGAHLHWPDVWRLAQRVPEDGFGRAALAAQAAFERFIAHLDHCLAEHRTPPRTRPLPIH